MIIGVPGLIGARGNISTLKQGLVSYWSLDEASGTRNDSFGTNHLTDNNTVTSSTGKVGNDAQFTAVNGEYLSRASNSSLQVSGTDFTITAWFKAASTPSFGNGYQIVTKDSDVASSRDYTLDMNNNVPGAGGFRFYTKGGAGGGLVVSSAVATVGQWYFLAAWYDSVTGSVHLRVDDTTQIDSANGIPAPDVSSAEFRIGARVYSGFQEYMDGQIDEVGFWKRLLTAGEITRLYNSGNGLAYGSF